MRAASIFFHRRPAIGKIGLWAASYFFALAALAGESKIIGYSNRSDATAQSNGRRIVRTSDDRRIVVYQDSLANGPIIVCVRSNDGRTWSPPAIVANGTFPALAVSNANWIYLVWALEDRRGIGLAYSTDGAMTWEPSLQIRPEATAASQFPAVEATTQAVHVVWQQKSLSGATEKICYQRFAKDLSGTLTPVLTLSSENFDSRLPVIAGDLEFKTDFFHLVWSEYPTPNGVPRLVYCNFMESAGPPGWGFMAPAVVPKSSGKIHPSISVRNFDFNGNLSAQITMACIDPINGRLMTAILHTNTTGIQAMRVDSITVGLNASTSVDDVYLGSCAIVWQNGGHIYYGQTRDERIITIPPIRVCNDTEAHCKNPNVGYKTFRRDSIDVVWTEGDRAPYRVMYRRMTKQYGPVAVEDARKNQLLPEGFALSQNHPNPFWSAATFSFAGNSGTEILFALPEAGHVVVRIFNRVGAEIRTLTATEYEAGYHCVLWDGKDNDGHSVASGLYLYRLQAGSFSQVRKMSLIR